MTKYKMLLNNKPGWVRLSLSKKTEGVRLGINTDKNKIILQSSETISILWIVSIFTFNSVFYTFISDRKTNQKT
jgi:hypothetical protein